MRCPTCGTIGVEGANCVVCGTRLPVQATPGATHSSPVQIPRAKPGTLGAFIANTSPAQFAPPQQPASPGQQEWSPMPANAPWQQMPQGWSQAPTGPQSAPQNWPQVPTAAQYGPQPSSPYPSGVSSGFPRAQQAPLPISPLAASQAQPGMGQVQLHPPTPDMVGLSNGGTSTGRLTVNVVLVFVVLALVGIPILFGLQRLSASTSSFSPTSVVAATRIPTAVPPTGMAAFLGDHLSIAYPSTWTHQQGTRGTAYGNAQVDTYSQDAGTYVSIFTVPSIPSDLLETGIDGVSGAAVAGSVPRPTTTNQRVEYNSVQWLEDDFTVSLVVDGHEVPEQMRVLGTNAALDTFVVVLLAPESTFATTNTSTFEPMLASLRLG